MRYRGRLAQGIFTAVIGWLILANPGHAGESGAPGFPELLNQAGMELSLPEGFTELELVENPLLQHARALRLPNGKLELRYVIRPLGRLEIDDEDPHSAVPDPNQMFKMLFHTLVGNLTKRGSRSPTREYSQTQAREFFNADWAAVSVFDVVPEYGDRYSQAMMLALHKNDLADAYTVFLFNDYAQVKSVVQKTIISLKFSK